MDHIEGYLIIGISEDYKEVIVNLPEGSETGHVTFSPNQARAMANLMIQKADDIDAHTNDFDINAKLFLIDGSQVVVVKSIDEHGLPKLFRWFWDGPQEIGLHLVWKSNTEEHWRQLDQAFEQQTQITVTELVHNARKSILAQTNEIPDITDNPPPSDFSQN